MSKTASSVRQILLKQGKTLPEWARENGFPVHSVWSNWSRVSERTLRDWVQAAEEGGLTALMPAGYRGDKGKLRVQITRRWQDGCGLPEEMRDRVATQMEGIARGLILKRCSARETRRLGATELQRLSVEAGVTLSCLCIRAWKILRLP